ncbi:unannotated protein [freshwater metagenome]|uniref:Adenosylcobinamide kinase n=1 Tax=freshwater metagenome TaxID=449393 RepID=A0A6J7CK95_9ZZZZ
MNGLTVLIGGARSGKSDLAVQIAQRFSGPVSFIATGQRIDDDMTERIARHRAERPPWPTIEAPTDLTGALRSVASDHLVIVDCLTLLVSNMMFAERTDEHVGKEAAAAVAVACARSAPTVVVTNEVGLGIHPDTELGRRYRDLLGRVNRTWASAAQRSLFLVAGRAIALHDPWEFLS